MPAARTHSSPSTTPELPVPAPGARQVRTVQLARQGYELSLDGQTFLLDQVSAENLYYALQDELGF